MDLEDEGWVNIPYDGPLEVSDDDDEKIFSRKYVTSPEKLLKPNYFDTPDNIQDFMEDEPKFENHGDEIKLEITCEPQPVSEPDQDEIFQVFFKKENQFVEMKMSSSDTEMDPFRYEEKSGDHVVNCSSPSKMIKQEVVDWEENNQKLNFWKWGLSGVGAFCSLGMAAATVCIIILGNGRSHKQQNPKLKIQFYSDNQKVVQQANEAISALRGVPLVKAQITYGGYYEIL